MMNILIVSQYFWPETFRINDLALGLRERGHQVSVLTGSPNYPAGKFYDGYSFFNKQEDYHGVKVLRVPLIPRGNGGGFRLALNYISFAVSASILCPLICRGDYDLVFVFQLSPVTQGLPAFVLKKIYKYPVFFWVQDLWPESLSATGAIRSQRILALVEKLVKFIYKRCDRILIQSQAFIESIVKLGGDPERIHYFPNSAENIFSMPCQVSGTLPPLPEGFKVMFAGNIGAAQDFETIICAAEKLKMVQNIHWIIVGDGRKRQWAETEVANRGLKNFHFLGAHPLATMPSFFSQADAMLVTLKKEPIFAMTIPSKIQSYLACGKPVIAALDGEGAKIIADSGAGWACAAEDSDAFSQAVLKMSQISGPERERMGSKGKAYYEAHFGREMLLDRVEMWMKESSTKRQGSVTKVPA